MREFFKRLFCRHRGEAWQILNIEWDGVIVCRCTLCGKVKRIHL